MLVRTRAPRWLALTLLLAVAATMLFGRLGQRCLWQDEAQTALISRTVLDHGVPLGSDGRNFFSQEGGAEYGAHYLWRWHTWLPFYVVAGSFRLLGTTTLAARLRFRAGRASFVVCSNRSKLSPDVSGGIRTSLDQAGLKPFPYLRTAKRAS